jgi:hypothetical protein
MTNPPHGHTRHNAVGRIHRDPSTHLRSCIRISVGLEELLHDSGMALQRCVVEWRLSVLSQTLEPVRIPLLEMLPPALRTRSASGWLTSTLPLLSSARTLAMSPSRLAWWSLSVSERLENMALRAGLSATGRPVMRTASQMKRASTPESRDRWSGAIHGVEVSAPTVCFGQSKHRDQERVFGLPSGVMTDCGLGPRPQSVTTPDGRFVVYRVTADLPLRR